MSTTLADRLAAGLGPRYQLRSELGRGGMGIVYRATDLELHRDVAIKLLPPELAADPTRRARFVREAQTAAGLSHPNIVAIHDVAERDGLVWFVMPAVEGESLRERVARTGPQGVALTARVLQEVGYALAYAHARGIVHRDIKPDNILLERGSGRALVTDFGIAKVLDPPPGTALTGEGLALGTTAYMSPEQAAAERDLDGRSDLYSLGLVGHFLLTGRDVHHGPNAQAVLARVLTAKVPAIRDQRPGTPAWLDAALAGCTAVAPDQRYRSAEELLEQLAVGGSPPEVHPAARKMVRLLGVYGIASVGLAYAWSFASAPPLDPLFVGLATVAALAVFVEVAVRASEGGVGWKELRDAIIDARRQLADERLWELKARQDAIRSPWKGRTALSVLAFGLILVFLGIGRRHESVLTSPVMDVLEVLALLYATSAALVLGWFLRLPRSAAKLAEWQPPRWLDRLGGLLFRRWGVDDRAEPVRPPEVTGTTTADTRRLVDRVIGMHEGSDRETSPPPRDPRGSGTRLTGGPGGSAAG